MSSSNFTSNFQSIKHIFMFCIITSKNYTILFSVKPMFAKKIEKFRNRHKLSVLQFCSAAHLPVSQYRSYLYEKKYLSIKDAVMLMASFPEELSINNLLGMNGEKELILSPNFPIFRFGNSKMDYEKSEKTFRNFYIHTAYEFFNPANAIRLLAAMTSPCDRLKIWLPTAENMYYLMYSLHDIRKLKFKDFKIPARTVLSHFQRNRLITRFTDLCEYERLFNSGGLYLLSELMYLNEKRDFGIISVN